MSGRSRIVTLADRLRSANPYVVDIALAAAVLVAVSYQFVLPERGGDEVTLQGVLLGVGTVVPLVWRRRAPFASALVVSFFTVSMAVHHAPAPEVNSAGLVSLYTVAALSRPWKRRYMLVGWTVGCSLTIAIMDGEPIDYGFHLLGIVAAYAIGVLTRIQRAYTAAVEDRARRLEQEAEAERARAAARERARIARDMHDILAHAVSLMVVQAEAGPVVVRADPDRAEAAFDAIAGAGRDAMAQLRRILGVLKEEPNKADALAPQPTVAGLPELVRRVTRTTGLRVELRTRGRPRPLQPDTEVAAYRVVQEALTNTVKHAGPDATALVELDWDAERNETLLVTVTDDGRHGPGAAAGRGRGQGAGHGLIGIRERAAACGGSAEAGPADAGGFRVAATLPTVPRRVAV
ncbi:histidine kinase [Streptomyces sp. B6B3]|uniref:sensor histidine kinase n=1 Tax=Streptomyces sp. B6B3 TaxID=3153570 RepID=UPI00325CB32F